MRLSRERFSEIVGATFDALARRGRLVVIGSCAVVLVASWWGAQRFADRLLTQIPSRTAPDAPTPLTAEEMQEQVRVAQELNAKLRAQRDAERAYALDETGGRLIDENSSADSAFAPIDWGKSDGRPAEPRVDVPAMPLYAPRAVRSSLARESGVNGTVIVRAHIGADGRVLDTTLERAIPMLNNSALDAVSRIRFRPAERAGKPVESWVSVPVTFED